TLSAIVQLVERPHHRALLMMGFADMFQAADQVPWILEHRPQALEGFDNRLIEFCRAKGGGTDVEGVPPRGGPPLMVKFGAATADEARGRAADLERRASRQPVAA